VHDPSDTAGDRRGDDALGSPDVDGLEVGRALGPEVEEAGEMEDDLASLNGIDHLLGAPDISDNRLRTEVSHLRHARDSADEAYDGVITPYERRDKRSTERAGRSGDEYSHDDIYRPRSFDGVARVTERG
jgi:hypothetical protein